MDQVIFTFRNGTADLSDVSYNVVDYVAALKAIAAYAAKRSMYVSETIQTEATAEGTTADSGIAME